MSDTAFPIMPGAEPWSYEHDAADAPGALVIHGFTDNPGSTPGLAEAFAKAGFPRARRRAPGAADAPGALVIHGFTDNPGSMRGLAEAFAKAGFHVEMPRLPGHGTSLDEMLTTSWTDWLGEAEASY